MNILIYCIFAALIISILVNYFMSSKEFKFNLTELGGDVSPPKIILDVNENGFKALKNIPYRDVSDSLEVYRKYDAIRRYVEKGGFEDRGFIMVSFWSIALFYSFLMFSEINNDFLIRMIHLGSISLAALLVWAICKYIAKPFFEDRRLSYSEDDVRFSKTMSNLSLYSDPEEFFERAFSRETIYVLKNRICIVEE